MPPLTQSIHPSDGRPFPLLQSWDVHAPELLAAPFRLPIGVLVYLVVSNINEGIGTARLEQKGDAYQRPLEGLLRDIQDQQLILHRCPEKDGCSARLAALKDSILKGLESLESVNKLYGVDLQFTPDGLAQRKRSSATVENLKKNWSELETAVGHTEPGKVPEALDAKYDAVVDIVKTMTTHMGDTSGLILDSDLDTYYLMCDTLVNLPLNQDRLARGWRWAGMQSPGEKSPTRSGRTLPSLRR